MKSKNHAYSAFPRAGSDGLTKREYIAAFVMQGLLARNEPIQLSDSKGVRIDEYGSMADECLKFTDTLLLKLDN